VAEKHDGTRWEEIAFTTNFCAVENESMDDCGHWHIHAILQLSVKSGKRYCIPTILGLVPKEIFSIQGNTNRMVRKQRSRKGTPKRQSDWSAIAKQDVWLKPESINMVPVISKGAPTKENLFFEAIPLDRGDSFVSAPHGLISLNEDRTAYLKLANTTN